MALLWWAVLLFRKNHEAHILRVQLTEQGIIPVMPHPKDQLTKLPSITELTDQYHRQLYMILGEAVVFGLTLVMGIYFINRAYVRELAGAEKQKNFLLSITHELKSPLASINLILSTFIKRDLPSATIKELSQDGIKEATRLEELFNKILISTRLGQAYPFNFEECDLSNLASSTAYRWEKLHQDVQLKMTVEADIVRDVDQESMVSVIKNLLENAYKYSPVTKEISLALSTKGDKIELCIADRGAGIPKEEWSKVFDQFYRVGSEDTRKSKGTGLGLYIVKQIVQAHKGKIQIANNEGGGTKVVVTL